MLVDPKGVWKKFPTRLIFHWFTPSNTPVSMSSSDITTITTTTTFLTPSSDPNPITLDFEDFLLLPHHPETASSTSLSPLINGGSWEVPEGDAGKFKIAFRTESEIEVMDDGYKWRKYGKKKIKDNSNPRHYYRCARQGCKVKKRVERDGEDGHFVITKYEGKHNHQIESPPQP